MFLKQLNNTDFWQNFNIFVTSEHSHSKENLTLRRKGGIIWKMTTKMECAHCTGVC